MLSEWENSIENADTISTMDLVAEIYSHILILLISCLEFGLVRLADKPRMKKTISSTMPGHPLAPYLPTYSCSSI